MVNLNIGTFNVKGLANDKKRKEIFYWLKEKKMNIYFLQETHCNNETESKFQSDWGDKCIFSNKNSQSAGVMILFNSNFDYEIEDYIKDNDGRFLICILKVNNEKILLANYYGLNSDEIYLLEDFCNRIEQFNDMPIVCGGDWNLIMENIDKKGGSSVLTHKKNREHLRQFMDRNDLIDIWRIRNPMEKRYSWRQKYPNIQCRLDSFLISVGLGNITRKTDISYGLKSDHSFILLEIDKQNLKRGKGFYKFNTSLLLDDKFIENLQKLIQEKETLYNNENINPTLIWELIKSDIRGYAIKYSSEVKKQETEVIKDKERELNTLEALQESLNYTDQNIENNILTIKNDLKTYFEKKTEGAIIRSKACWLREGERNSKFFFNLERRNYINKSIQTLVTDSGHTVSKFTDVLNEQNKFYSSLYSNKETEDNLNVHLVDKFFPDDAEIPKLNENEKESCEGMISEEECVKAIKSMQNGKSPGTDGLPVEFYKIFWKNIKKLVMNSFSYSYENENMSISQKQSIITLLPQKK